MNCNKSENFMKKWESDSIVLSRKLTEFSLQLTPTKFADMINYKKVLMENLSPEDFEYEVYSDGKEVYSHVTDSKMKSLCLKKAGDIIKKLEFSMKNPDEAKEKETLGALQIFIDALEVKTTAFGTSVCLDLDFDVKTICIGDTEIKGIKNPRGITFDVLTFNEGYTHTFVLRFELENGDMYSFYSAIGRDGVKGEKPQIFASCFVDGYYISTKIEHNIY